MNHDACSTLEKCKTKKVQFMLVTNTTLCHNQETHVCLQLYDKIHHMCIDHKHNASSM